MPRLLRNPARSGRWACLALAPHASREARSTTRTRLPAGSAARKWFVARGDWGSLLAAPGVLDLFLDESAIDIRAVTGQRALPRANRFVELSEAREHVAVMILNDGLRRQGLSRLAQRWLG